MAVLANVLVWCAERIGWLLGAWLVVIALTGAWVGWCHWADRRPRWTCPVCGVHRRRPARIVRHLARHHRDWLPRIDDEVCA